MIPLTERIEMNRVFSSTPALLAGLLAVFGFARHATAAAWLTNSLPQNNKLVIGWSSRGVLERADQLGGPWTTLSNAPNPFTNTITPNAQFFRLNQTVDATTLRRKVMCGYQGWFKCPGDSGGGSSWFHWSSSQSQFTSNTITFEMWPDMSEYANRYPAGSFTYPDGSQAQLFSPQDRQAVDKHFDWMQDYGIDGVFVQRFLVDIAGRPWMTNVLNNVRAAANRTGRAFALTYDMTSQSTSTLFSALTNDWTMLVNTQHVTQDPRYLHHNGKPVLELWGFYHDRMSAELAMQIITYFKSNANVTLIGGGDWQWETDTTTGWPQVFRSFDVISPWNVGNYMTIGTNKYAATNSWSSGIAAATNAGMLWLPVVYPGFSWDNLKKKPPGTTKVSRLNGDFLWRQFYDVAIRGVDMAYVAMFDEVDEGTAIFKVTNHPPTQAYFLTYEGLPADWYLRLTAEGSKVISGERPNQRAIPISP
jgi:hypothetical protein